jgi:hypothetical protein
LYTTVVRTNGYLRFSWDEKLVAPLIATPNVDIANRRQEKSKKLNYKLHVILMQKGIVFVFANYLDDALVGNYAMVWFNSLTAIRVPAGTKNSRPVGFLW